MQVGGAWDGFLARRARRREAIRTRTPLFRPGFDPRVGFLALFVLGGVAVLGLHLLADALWHPASDAAVAGEVVGGAVLVFAPVSLVVWYAVATFRSYRPGPDDPGRHLRRD